MPLSSFLCLITLPLLQLDFDVLIRGQLSEVFEDFLDVVIDEQCSLAIDQQVRAVGQLSKFSAEFVLVDEGGVFCELEQIVQPIVHDGNSFVLILADHKEEAKRHPQQHSFQEVQENHTDNCR